MKQKFYCKKCEKEFEIDEKDKYHNYKCPVCFTMSLPKDYIGLTFRGCDTIGRRSRYRR